MPDKLPRMAESAPSSELLTKKRRDILNFIDHTQRTRGYPPSVREIGEACQLASPASVQFHLKVLQQQGFLERDPSKPRALRVHLPRTQELGVGAAVMQVPMLGDVAAGLGTLAEQNFSGEMVAVPQHLGPVGTLFALRVKGDSMVGDGIFERDVVVARRQSTADVGEIVVAGIFDQQEATIKRIDFDQAHNRVTLKPSNPAYTPMDFAADEVQIYGKVVFLQREI